MRAPGAGFNLHIGFWALSESKASVGWAAEALRSSGETFAWFLNQL